MNYEDEENLDELMELYGSESAVQEAKEEKKEGYHEDMGVLLKDYPNVQRELDLHGMIGPEAKVEITRFIDQCIHQRVLTARVICGKGLHSAGFKSVLPEVTERKLADLRRAGKVFTFKREKTGGSFLVYLVS
jgi:DNA-nicking Smr family endonuclease